MYVISTLGNSEIAKIKGTKRLTTLNYFAYVTHTKMTRFGNLYSPTHLPILGRKP